MFRWIRLLTGLSLTVLTIIAAAESYTSANIDKNGQLHIRLDTGGEVLAPRLKYQVSFGWASVSPDRRTVGWLAEYPFPVADGDTPSTGSPIAAHLVLYQGGHTIHDFPTNQVFWDWQFQDGGRRVAYSTGPTHGGAAECVLRDVDSGKILARWLVGSGKAPAWAMGLRQ